MAVIVKDRIWQRIKKNLGDEEREVGVQKDAVYPDGKPVAVVAAANEFGTSQIPARSFIRSTTDEERGKINRILGRDTGRLLDLKEKKGSVVQEAAEHLRDAIKQKIEDLDSPRNAPSTVKRKGFNNPLVDTRKMKDSIVEKKVKG